MNIFFILDLIISFFYAFHDKDFKLIDDYREISKRYLKGWFLVDLMSCLPLDFIFSFASLN